MLRRSLPATRRSGARRTAAPVPGGAPLPDGPDAGTADSARQSPHAGPAVTEVAPETAGPGLFEDAGLAAGPVSPGVPRRPQHQNRVPSRRPEGRSRGNWVAFGLSTATVAALVAGAVEGLTADRNVARGPATSATSPVLALPDGRQEDVAAFRANASAAATAERARAQAAATAERARAQAAATAAARREQAAAAAAQARRQAAAQAARSATRSSVPAGGGSPKAVARAMLAARGWSAAQFRCLDALWERESGWNYRATNPSSGAYGIPQALPGSKMASAGADWRTNPTTQIRWGLNYIAAVYRAPCGAWSHSQATGWY